MRKTCQFQEICPWWDSMTSSWPNSSASITTVRMSQSELARIAGFHALLEELSATPSKDGTEYRLRRSGSPVLDGRPEPRPMKPVRLAITGASGQLGSEWLRLEPAWIITAAHCTGPWTRNPSFARSRSRPVRPYGDEAGMRRALAKRQIVSLSADRFGVTDISAKN